MNMGNWMKEDDRIEKIIRGLLKLPANRRCINCNCLGPQYVCTTFWTFVCTNCSGIHREFTHRVKSVSMAKFTAEEVSALEAGGNEKAKQIYFKEWNPQRHSFPDSSNIYRLRDFIKHVYVERKFSGERSSDKLPTLRLNDKEESHESRKVNAYRLGSKSPHYEDRFERHGRSSPDQRSDDMSFRFYYDERRSPRYAQKHSRNGHQRSPIKFEVVDDRFRDDEFRSRRLSNLESKLKKISYDGQNNAERSQPPVADRPVGESLGKNVPSLAVGQIQTKEADDSRQNQKASLSSGYGSSKKHPTEQKTDNPESLIDLSTKSQISDATDGPQTQTLSQSSEDNWATFEFSAAEKAPQTSNGNTSETNTTERTPQITTANTLESILFELSGPLHAMSGGLSKVPCVDDSPSTATVGHVSTGRDLPPTSVGHATALPNDTGAMSVTPTSVTRLGQPSNGVPPQVESYGRDDSIQVSHGNQLPSMQLPSESTGYGSTIQSTSQPVRAEAFNNQPSVAPNRRDSWSAFTESSGQTTTKPAKDARSEIKPQPSPMENKSSGRKELPEDLFTASYLSGPAPGWHNVQPRGSGFGMQYYPNAVPCSAFPVVASINPFDVTEGKAQVQASRFPTLATLQGALPSGSAKTGLLHASSLGSSGLTVPQSPSYASLGPPQSPFAQSESPFAPPQSPFALSQSPFASGIPAGAYIEQVHNNTQPSRPQRTHSFSNDRTAFGSLATTQQLASGYGVGPTTPPHCFSKTRGNPFG